MSTHRFLIASVMVVLTAPAYAQQTAIRGRITPQAAIAAAPVAVLESTPLESMALVRNAPFFAEAVTEFTQILGDGNRIERRYASSIARDSSGRTRREEEIAMVGPLAATGPAPKLVTILDPVTGLTYTLDENLRVAFRNSMAPVKLQLQTAEKAKVAAVGKGARGTLPVAATRVPSGVVRAAPAGIQAFTVIDADASASKAVVEALGTRSIEGLPAEGIRSTTTIPAGAIGNVMPIEIVTERWFSEELQLPVLITRRDPRSGETVYRLTSIVRAEPSQDLFTVPPGYDIRDGKLGVRVLMKLDEINGATKKK